MGSCSRVSDHAVDGSNTIVKAMLGMGSSSVSVLSSKTDKGPGAECVSAFTDEHPQ